MEINITDDNVASNILRLSTTRVSRVDSRDTVNGLEDLVGSTLSTGKRSDIGSNVSESETRKESKVKVNCWLGRVTANQRN
jgi:hypothetical protein